MKSGGRYGDLGEPEYRADVGRDAEPLQFVESAYSQFRKTAGKIIAGEKNWMTRPHTPVPEIIYQEACRLFDGVTGLKEYTQEIVDNIRAKAAGYDGTGLFLSAMMNRTEIDIMAIDNLQNLDFPGYRIPEGKTLVIGDFVNAYSAGRYGRGTVLNWGPGVKRLADRAEGGIQIGWRGSQSMGRLASGGLQINFSAGFDADQRKHALSTTRGTGIYFEYRLRERDSGGYISKAEVFCGGRSGFSYIGRIDAGRILIREGRLSYGYDFQPAEVRFREDPGFVELGGRMENLLEGMVPLSQMDVPSTKDIGRLMEDVAGLEKELADVLGGFKEYTERCGL